MALYCKVDNAAKAGDVSHKGFGILEGFNYRISGNAAKDMVFQRIASGSRQF